MSSEPSTKSVIVNTIENLRWRLDREFSPDTAAPSTRPGTPSAGHCAVASIIVRELLGGDHVSAAVHGVSHWFNLVPASDTEAPLFVDVTADQFGMPAIIAEESSPHEGWRLRDPADINADTWRRAFLLMFRLTWGGRR